MIKHYFATALLAIASLGSAAAMAQEKPVTFRFGHTHPATDSQHVAAQEFAKRVEERSNGKIKIRVFANGALGNDNTLVTGVRSGTIDIGVTGNPFLTGISPNLNVLDLPYLFNDEKHAFQVLDGPIGRGLLDDLDNYGLKGLAFWDIGFRNITNNKHPIQTAADISGLKIRTTPNPAHIKAFELLGANPQPMAFTEVYTALESGALDGQENPATLILSSKMYEVQKYLSMTRHAYTAALLFMNKRKFDKLSPENQKMLLEEALTAANHERDLNAKHQETALKELREHGVEVNENPDVDSIRKIAKGPVHAEFAKKQGDKILNAIVAAQQ